MIKRINEFNLFATVYSDGQFGLLSRNSRGEFYAFAVQGEIKPEEIGQYIEGEYKQETWYEIEIYKAGFIKVPRPTTTKGE